MLKILLLTTIGSLLCIAQITAQQPNYWQLTDYEGLPSMQVYDIEQDQLGYIWIGTEAGLFRYNGIDFDMYSCKTAKATAIGNLQIDELGRIWCQNFSDQIFYVENNQLHECTYHQSSDAKKFNSFGVNKYGLWLASGDNKTVYRFLHQTGEKIEYKLGDNQTCTAILCNNNNEIIICASSEILEFDPKTNSLIAQPSREFKTQNEKNEIIYQLYCNNDNLLGYQGGLNKINLILAGKAISFPYEFDQLGTLLNLYQLNDSTVWIGGSNGIYDIKLKNGQWQLNKEGLFNGNYITSIFKDRENTLWLTTLRNGIIIVPNYQLVYYNLKGQKSSNAAITSLLNIRNNLILCSNTGETFIGNTQKAFKVLEPKFQYEIEASAFFRKNQLIIGYQIYNYPSFTPVKTLTTYSIKGVEYYNNKLYFVSNLGSFFLSPESNSNEKPLLIRQLRTRAMTIDSTNKLWYVAYTDGLFVHDLNNTNNFWEIKHLEESIYVKTLKKGENNTIWAGTMGQGLFGLVNGKIAHHYTTENGLLSNHINDVFEYNGELWISTNVGLQAFDLQNNTSKVFSRSDGLSSNEVTKITIINNRVWAATARNLNSFPVNLNAKNTANPPVFISCIKIDNDTITNLQNATINHDHKTVEIVFNGLAFKSKNSVSFKYRTVGLDSTWHYITGANNRVTLYAIQPGNYTFQVVALNEDLVESTEPATFHFMVETPFTQSIFFYIIIFIGIIGVTSLIFISRINLIRNKNEVEQLKNVVALEKSKLQKELRESQLSALKVQLNPHFMFNALNSIQEFILLNERTQANRFLGKFADLMRITLDMSNQNRVLLEEEIKCLTLYLDLEGLRFEDTFTYSIEVAQDINPKLVEIPSMLIQPYVENAIKHGLLHIKTNRILIIRFNLTPSKKELMVEIEDNGIGIEASAKINKIRKKEHKSFATSANQRRLELLNTGLSTTIVVEIIDLKTPENIACGTLVKLIIPISKE